jgi:hypothetical protein
MPKAKAKIAQPVSSDTVVVLLGEIRKLDDKSEALSAKMKASDKDKIAWAELNEKSEALTDRVIALETAIQALQAQSLEGALVQIAMVISVLGRGFSGDEEQDLAEQQSCANALRSAASIIETKIGRSDVTSLLHKFRYLPRTDCPVTIN